MHAQAPPGGAIRLNNSMEHPLGAGGVDSNPLCIPFRGVKLRTLAIVGNGPIDETQRREINVYDLVIRCAHDLCLSAAHALWRLPGNRRHREKTTPCTACSSAACCQACVLA